MTQAISLLIAQNSSAHGLNAMIRYRYSGLQLLSGEIETVTDEINCFRIFDENNEINR